MEQWYSLIFTNISDMEHDLQEMIYDSLRNFLYQDIYFLLNDHAFTEDVIQEIFLKVVAIGDEAQISNKKAWIKRVARNTAYDLLKRNKKYQYIFDSSAENNYLPLLYPLHDEVAVSSHIEKKIQNDLLYQAITELKEDYRTVLLLYYFEEKSYKEIMEKLSISQGALTQRLVRARKKLQQKFSEKYG